ncbi:MAG: ATP-dependent DNA helicase [Candidatus Saccharibacteria bacterium]
MDQKLALDIMMRGESVFLTGPAGSGKTYVLNQFIKQARKEGLVLAVTATTGLAATHLSGTTIHAWSGLGVRDELEQEFFDHMRKDRRKLIKETDVLIIDEVSMLHDYRLDMIDDVCRHIRKNSEPFGGLQVILCGDFFQLPPVNRAGSRGGGFVVRSRAWEALDPVICYLEEQHRQDDDTFLDILNALRAGDVRRRHAEALLERVDAELPNHHDVTELHTVNVDVDAINRQKLAALKGDEHQYTLNTFGPNNFVETLKRSCMAAEDLVLKKGALVMFLKNNPEKRWVNGTLGTVINFEKVTDYPIVELMDGRKITVEPDTWELRDGDLKRASLAQIPLRLAWAITVHKSQGMTLDAAKIDLRRAFVEGMGYVALSRVRSLQTLTLVGINRMALKISNEALEVDAMLRRKCAQDAQRFAEPAAT